MNPQVRQVFVARTRLIQTVRRILDAKGFLEVETPTLQPLYGGAAARPFVTFYNALGHDFYLRIANELYLKRLIVGGFEGVYEICKDFRNEGMDRTHNPEFTQVEFYWAYRDYHDMMALIEEIFTTIAKELTGALVVEWEGQPIDLTPPWPRRPMLDLIGEHAGVWIRTLDDEALRRAVHRVYESFLDHDREKLSRACADLPSLSRGSLIDELFKLTVEPHLSGPIFVMDYPVEISPLAKVHRQDPALTERFELFVLGREMANSFSELNDPLDQRQRFEQQERLIQAGDEEAQPLDEDFLRALEYGMPPTGGAGLGLDRLTMFFTNQSSIQDVILFPHLRPERHQPAAPQTGRR
jgi:lysyl-tRNA synthetase class 2